ncbi:hypothetical protein BGZ65_004018, partial [Modicella reniformis]
MAQNSTIDTLEVLLNPSIIKTKLSNLTQEQTHVQGRKLLQDLLSIARFGTPAIVPSSTLVPGSGIANDRTPGHDDSGDQLQQTMQLSERQDMLLGQACRVYQLASLSLDDIFDQVPQPNQFCLITAMMLHSQKPNSEVGALIIQEEPWDPLTLLQRWIIRARIAGNEDSGLDLGETRYHAEALERKLDVLAKTPTSERVQTLQCQILSELGQFYCWDGEYVQALKYFDKCHEVHKQHSATSQSPFGCHLDANRTTALSNLSRLATCGSQDDDKGQLLSHIKGLEQEERHFELVDAFQEDNVARLLPYSWRQRVLGNVLSRSDLENGTFLAIANALYNLRDPSEMMLEIPSRVLLYLRSVTFESGHEADAYHSPSIFEDLMQYIVKIQEAYTTSTVPITGTIPATKDKIRSFVSKICNSIRHVLCYEAAWTSGNGMEGLMNANARDTFTTEDSTDQAEQIADQSEAAAKSLILEQMDPDELEEYLRAQSKFSPFTSSLIMLAMGAQACTNAKYLEAVRYFQITARFMQEQDPSTPGLQSIELQFIKYSAWSRIGILADEHDKRRLARIYARLEQRVKVKTEAAKRARQYSTEALAEEEEERAIEATDMPQQHGESNAMEIDATSLLRCLAICINGKQWDFLSGYGRTAAEALDKSIHGEICQVYSVLVPLCAIVSRSQELGVDLKDIASFSCLVALFSSDLDPIRVTQVAAYDMIQGLMPNVPRLVQQHPPQQSTAGGGGHGHSNRNRWGRKSIQEESTQQPIVEDDLGHAAILKLCSMVRLRGVVDIFGALLAGAVSSILPERAKLTLSEFGYYALFTTSMDCVSSWTDSRVKIIAMLSNGESGKAIEAVPGARQRFAKLLIQVYERQIQYESDTLTRKLCVEAKILGLHRFDSETGLSADAAHTMLFSTKAGSQITRYSLCLTDIYHLEGMHQDALASFLNA